MRAGAWLEPAPPDAPFRFPKPSRSPWWIWIVVAALHSPIVFLPLGRTVEPDPARPPLIMIDPAQVSARDVAMPFVPERTAARSRGPSGTPTAAPPRIPSAPPGRATPVPSTFITPVDSGAGIAPPAASGQVATPVSAMPVPAGRQRIAPTYGSGRLWVRPLPVSPQELASQLRSRTHVERVDSAVTAIIQDYLDRLAAEEVGRAEPLPSWTTTIAGEKVGIDSKWIHLGPIRVPTFLLGLIPLNVQANPTQAEMSRRLAAMREDLYEAARRSANYADFKAAVARLREEKQRERDFEKAQRTAPSERGGKP